MVNYKLHIPKNTLFYSDTEGTNRVTWSEYWTTITAEENATDSELIRLGKKNLKIQMAIGELFNPALYQTIGLENEYIEIIRP